MIHTAALVLVGSELIRGGVADLNGPFLTEELTSVGVKTVSIHMIRDEIESVADLVRHLSSRATCVITVGGLGPTLDDVTLEAVGRAFGLNVVTRQADDIDTFARMSGSETIHPLLHRIPDGAEVIPTDHGPVVRTLNVYSLPGLPRLVRARFPIIARRLGAKPIECRSMSLAVPQSVIAAVLEKAGRKYPGVTIGCYPSATTLEGTSVTFEGSDAEDVRLCVSFVEAGLAEPRS
jgi:molybdenum cofactor synthesis domain-containing protein